MREWPRLAAQYRAALPEVTSPEAWEETFRPWTEGAQDPAHDRPADAEGRRRVAERHDLAHVPMVDPAAKGGLLGVLRRRYLLRLMVKRELRARYIGSKMGLVWSYINPLSRFFTYYFVFGDHPARAVRSRTSRSTCSRAWSLVNFFTESFNSGTRSIMQNKAVVQKMPLPREIFPIASMLVSLYHTGPQLVILIVACLVTGSFAPDPVGMLAALLGLGDRDPARHRHGADVRARST